MNEDFQAECRVAGRLGWAAGFFDGEGCVMIQQRRRAGWSYVMQISAAQKYPEALYRLLEIVEYGSVHQTKRHESYGCDMWTWRASGRHAAIILRRLLPFLVVKREQAEVAISFQERRLQTTKEKKNKVIVAQQYEHDEVARLRLKSLKRESPTLLIN